MHYIETDMNMPGAVLIFLPGWNLIFALQKYLLQKPLFGIFIFLLIILKISFSFLFFFFIASSKFIILPLHSQLPCADQRKVFEPVPAGKRKVDVFQLHY